VTLSQWFVRRIPSLRSRSPPFIPQLNHCDSVAALSADSCLRNLSLHSRHSIPAQSIRPMESYSDASALWDLSQASSFSQLPDDDFLALLQKQFPTNPPSYSTDYGISSNSVNPQTISRYSLPSLTPPSEDSSPSPPQQSGSKSPDDDHDHALKRKASDDSLDEEPNQKSQHTRM
jgi:hypothetical protein